MTKKLSVVVVGAHPDDCEEWAGGVTIRYRESGHRVTYITTTNGDAGHHAMNREDLRKRRYEEMRKASKCLDIECIAMDVHDGCLEPTLENRLALIGLLRKCGPDIIITHSLNDYHPDHRYTVQLVSDTAYMLGVPLCVPDVPVVEKPVVYCHISFMPQDNASTTVLVPVDKQMDKKLLAIHQYTSQMYEWLCWVDGIDIETVPRDEDGRLEFLHRRWDVPWLKITESYREKISHYLNAKAAGEIRYVEAFTASSLGFPLTSANAKEYFPFSDALIF